MREVHRYRILTAYKVFLVLVPFLFCLGNAASPFELIKLFALVSFSFITASIVAISWIKTDRLSIHWNTFLTLLAGFLAANLLSSFFSIDHTLSFWGDDQLPADSLLSLLALFAFCFSIVQLQPLKKDLLDFLRIIVLTTCALAIHSLFQYSGVEFASFTELIALKGRLIATVGQPVILSTVFVCTIPLIALLHRLEQKASYRVLLIMGFILIETAIFLSESRTPWLMNLFVLAIYLKAWLPKLNRKTKLISMAGAGLVLIGLLTWLSQPSSNHLLREKLSAPALQKGLQSRLAIWKDGLSSFQEHPILGSGPETFGIEQKKNQSLILNQYEYWKTYWAKAHNSVVQVIVSTGLLGLLFFLAPYLYILFRLTQKKKTHGQVPAVLSDLALAIFIIFICNLTSFNFILTQTYASLFLIIFSLYDDSSTQPTFQSPLTSIYRLAIGLIVLIQIGLTVSTGAYWYSDFLLQKSYTQLSSQTDPLEALELADQALQLNSSNPFVYCHKANVLLDILLKSRPQMNEEQLKDFIREIDTNGKICIDLAPHRYQSYLSRGRAFSILFQQGLLADSTEAEKNFREFNKLAPRHPGPFFEMAMLDLKNQKNDAFVDKMSTVLKLKSDFLPAYTELIRFYLKTKNDKEIDTLVAQVLTTNFISGEFVPEIKSIAALCHDHDKQNLAEQLENLYQHKKDLILKKY